MCSNNDVWDFNLPVKKNGKLHRCCRRFYRKHGQPYSFVTRLFTHPARTLDAYSAERAQLISELAATNACTHAVNAALNHHTRGLANSRHDVVAPLVAAVNEVFTGVKLPEPA